jgi:hypothetical protein
MSSPSALALSDTRPSSKRACVALVFGLGGLISGLTLAFAVFILQSGIAAADGKPGFLIAPALELFLTFFIWDLTGVLFLLILTAAFILCRSLGWLDFKPVLSRFLAAAILIILAPWWGILAAFFGDFLPRPASGTAPIAFCMMAVGIFVAVLLLSFALYVLTNVWDYRTWRAMMLFALVLVAATIALCSELFRLPSGEASDYVVLRGLSFLHIAGQTLFGACSGYWLARSQKSAAASS